jgi:tetratricopeptide (TPR) repeat protein
MPKFRVSIRLIWLIGLLTLCACSSPDEKANKLFVEASGFVKQAREAENISYVKAYKLYNTALANIEKITSKYPSSNMAVQIAQGQLLLDLYKIPDFRTSILENSRARAQAEEDPFLCSAQIEMETGLIPWHVSSIVETLNESGQKAKAEALLSRSLRYAETMMVRDELQRTGFIMSLAKSYYLVGEKEKAKQVLVNLFESTSKVRSETCWRIMRDAASACKTYDAITRNSNWSGVGEGFAQIGEYEKAEEVAGKITDENYKAWVYTAIGADYAKLGQGEKALAMMEKAEAEIKKPKATVSDSLRIKMGLVYAKVGLKERADEILSEALKAAMKSGKSYEVEDTLEAFLEAGFYDKVVPVAEKEGLGNLLVKAAIGYAKSGQFEKSLSISERNPKTKFGILCNISEEYAKIGQKDKGMALLATALEEARAQKETVLKFSGIVNVATYYGKLGEKNKAIELLTEAAKLSDSIDTKNKINRLTWLAEAYIKVNDVKMASTLLSQHLQLAKSLRGEEVASQLRVAGALCTEGKIQINDEDKKILHDILRDSIKQSGTESKG